MSKSSGPIYLGVEIGGTKLQIGLGAGDGRLLALERSAVVRSNGAAGVLDQIARLSAALLSKMGLDAASITACGVGFGGPVDHALGKVVKSHQVEGWEDFQLAEWVRQTLRIPCVSIHNDADAAGLAEALYGAARGLSPVVYVTIGSGIGGGLIIDGAIYRGAGAGALEIGHLLVRDAQVSAEGWSELELVASGWSIARRAQARSRDARQVQPAGPLAPTPTDRTDAAKVASEAAKGDAKALEVLREAIDALSEALAHVITLIAPRCVVLGGGVSLIEDELWLEPIRKRVLERGFPLFANDCTIETAVLGEEVVVHGALAVARAEAERESVPASSPWINT
jgi:glucokinase